MEYSKLLDLTTELGYRLAMSGAETFRVEESVVRVLKAYDIDAEVFAIPSCLHISIEPVIGRPLTRMRRIGEHGNDLDAVEKFTNLSRRICTEQPAPEIAQKWLQDTIAGLQTYPVIWHLLGHACGAFGFCLLFGGILTDSLVAGVLGLLIGLVNRFTDRLEANQFFKIFTAAFLMALPAYGLGYLGVVRSADAVVTGVLMLLVPGLLVTNALRDIIHGDTNSGINRIVQVVLLAMAIVLGTASAWTVSGSLWGAAPQIAALEYNALIHAIAAFFGCFGFSIMFNIRLPGSLLCVAGGILTWMVYLLTKHYTGNDYIAYFASTFFAAVYAEIMARIRKYPAISYLVISIIPLIPGASVYFTMNYAIQGQMDAFMRKGLSTAAIAGIMGAAILLGSTLIRLLASAKKRK